LVLLSKTIAVTVWKRSRRPEFRNRLDSVVQFNPLNEKVIEIVVDKFLTELQAQLDDKKVQIEVDQAARAWLAEEGYDEKMGARPMQRLIQEKIKRGIAEDLLFGSLSDGGGTVYVTADKNGLSISVEGAKAPAAEKAEDQA